MISVFFQCVVSSSKAQRVTAVVPGDLRSVGNSQPQGRDDELLKYGQGWLGWSISFPPWLLGSLGEWKMTWKLWPSLGPFPQQWCLACVSAWVLKGVSGNLGSLGLVDEKAPWSGPQELFLQSSELLQLLQRLKGK